ncbi:hypothetical protein WMF37_06850 [Sorangium sp. So ce291]|uniref:hypothetical protein n=1 Tax=Sorangium sp. So ce291 TaxID=3133294 RepID=UPI003F6327BA
MEVGGKAVVQPGTLFDDLIAALDFDAFQRIDLSAEFENQGVTKDDVDAVHIVHFTLRIEEPGEARVSGRPDDEMTITADVLLDVDVNVPGC